MSKTTTAVAEMSTVTN